MTDNWYVIVRFNSEKILQGQQLAAATLRVTAFNTTTQTNTDFGVYGFKGGSVPDPTSSLIAAWIAAKTTKTFAVSADLGEQWTAGHEYSLTTSVADTILEVLQELIDDSDFDGDFGLYFYAATGAVDQEVYTIDSDNSNDGKYMELDLEMEKENYPFWIDCKLVKKPYLTNMWRATIEIEGRWGL